MAQAPVRRPSRHTAPKGHRAHRWCHGRYPDPAARKTTLVVHLISGIGWLGVDVVLLILTFTGFTSDDPATVAACYQAMGLLVVPCLLTAGLTSLASGILLGLGTKYGLLRYW